VNVVLRGLRGTEEIRALRDHRGSKGIPVALALRGTEEIRGLQDRREYPALPAPEVPEEIPVR